MLVTCQRFSVLFLFGLIWQYCPNVSTTPITAMWSRQCLPLSVVHLKGKHCQKAHCRSGVADTFGDRLKKVFHNFSGDCWNLEKIFRVYLEIVLEALYCPCVAKDPQVFSKCVICFPLKQYIHSTVSYTHLTLPTNREV